MSQLFEYQPQKGVLYAETFALYNYLPKDQRLFYYEKDADCTNFISQCVWAAYGGWIPGFSPDIVAENKERIKNDVRQTSGVWYGSASNIGSTKWCRVVEFYDYSTDRNKQSGPAAALIAEGNFETIDPSIIRTGDVIQLLVKDYVPDRYGHGVYVTHEADSWSYMLVCCHTNDMLNQPMSDYAKYPQIYPKVRVMRFYPAVFEK